jgi:hypothetical protein
MNILCPISDKTVYESVTRITALFTFLSLCLYFIYPTVVIPVFLAADFFIRAIQQSSYSPFFNGSVFLSNKFEFNKKRINAGPKIFAARIGLFLSVLILILWLMNFTVPAFLVAAILLVFSFLEAALGFCMACIIYPFVYRLMYHKEFRE